MIEDKEVWACAHQLMRQYGDAASFHAAQRADELLADNDLEGVKTWVRIANRIEQLEKLGPDGRIH
ncbi:MULTISPECIES: DUF6961 family protein [unclassified Sphingomonas]|uniref:DUF6961 family protein n=1 Tax=unclassified Sphingomonas TaxID=196159 RepID=UPI0006F33783|nr:MULTISPECIES: hypothetical protein [unclassified Sphingomonas]KQX19051.1 hypothetical protein ASD17_10790 [Sphingomonas sp. Root1294]KQY65252.1 hypothetical protein ASD39_13985 [Sphingomonas sp. Root50]KRB95454.1 hypothetical protein ASE22_06070 [Sphingomonas sp. Root720]